MPHKVNYHRWRSRHYHFSKTLHQIWIVQQNHLWPRTPNFQQNSRKNSEEYLDMNLPYHPPTTHRLMERPKELTKKLKLTFGYSVDQILLNGLNKYPWQNLSTTSDPTPPPVNPHSISSWDMNHKHSCRPWACQTNHEELNSVKIHTFHCWRQGMARSKKP